MIANSKEFAYLTVLIEGESVGQLAVPKKYLLPLISRLDPFRISYADKWVNDEDLMKKG
jgi:hypothetical protein